LKLAKFCLRAKTLDESRDGFIYSYKPHSYTVPAHNQVFEMRVVRMANALDDVIIARGIKSDRGRLGAWHSSMELSVPHRLIS